MDNLIFPYAHMIRCRRRRRGRRHHRHHRRHRQHHPHSDRPRRIRISEKIMRIHGNVAPLQFQSNRLMVLRGVRGARVGVLTLCLFLIIIYNKQKLIISINNVRMLLKELSQKHCPVLPFASF